MRRGGGVAQTSDRRGSHRADLFEDPTGLSSYTTLGRGAGDDDITPLAVARHRVVVMVMLVMVLQRPPGALAAG